MAGIRDLIKLPELQHGIHDNAYVSKFKFEGINEMPMARITFIKIDKEENKKLAKVDGAMFKPKVTEDRLYYNVQQLFTQFHNILASVMDDSEAAMKVFGNVVEDTYGDLTLADFKGQKFNKKTLDKLISDVVTKFEAALKPYQNAKHLIRLKVVSNSKGDHVQLPSRGVYTEPMSKETTSLLFTQFEKTNNAKADMLVNLNVEG